MRKNTKTTHQRQKQRSQENQTKYSLNKKVLPHKTQYTSKSVNDNAFAKEYVKITKDIKNILTKNIEMHQQRREYVNSERIKRYSSLKKNEKMELKSSQSERQMKKIVTVNKEIKPLQPYINLKKQDELYVHLEEEKDIKVNRKFQYVSELLAHFDNLFKIRGYLEDFPNSYEFIIKAIKRYVLNYGKADINKLQTLLVQEKQKNRLKRVLSLQRIFVIGIGDGIIHQRYLNLQKQCNNIFSVFIGVYYYIFSFLAHEADAKYKQKINNVINILDGLDYHYRKQLSSTLIYLQRKIPAIFRFNTSFYQKINKLLKTSQKQGYTINRTFYVLLSDFARCLNEQPQILNNHKKLLESFACCPSPHLPFSRNNFKITIIFSFQGTLTLPKTKTNKIPIKLRPYALELLKNLNRYYEIVLFTYLMPQDIDEKLQIFSYCHAILYRYHAIRIKSSFIKDLSKIGRDMSSIIIVDDRKQNFPLHPANGIVLNTWRGNPKDQELKFFQSYLTKLNLSKQTDVRKQLKVTTTYAKTIFEDNQQPEQEGNQVEKDND